MKMIGHDDELIQGNLFTDDLRPQSFIPNYPSDSTEDDFTIDNIPKQKLSAIGTDSHKISTRLRIIEPGQTNRSTMSASCG
jgi:hypothetical protein